MDSRSSKKERFLSFVIPAKNEEESLPVLMEEIRAVTEANNYKYEIIFINDGSSDNTFEVMRDLCEKFPNITALDFSSNYGKASALDAGFELAKGDLIFTMDADLQDDPKEIPALIAKLDEGFDMVSGWKFNRLDPLISKKLPSKLANGVMRKVSGVKIHDMNCGFKVYRRSVAKSLTLRGDMHRFIPAILSANGFKIAEIVVEHRKRQFGKSNYGFGRIFTSFFDFLTVLMVTKYMQKPFHLFGFLGLVVATLSSLGLLYLFGLWLTDPSPIGNRPLFHVSLVGFTLSFQLFIAGLLTELIVRGNSRKQYHIAEVIEAKA